MSETGDLQSSNTLTYHSKVGGLSWLTEQLAVSGCFAAEAVAALADVDEVAAVVDLREEDCDDERALRDAGIAFLHLPTRRSLAWASACSSIACTASDDRRYSLCA